MTDLQPGETRTYTAEIPQGEAPKEIRMDIRTDPYAHWHDWLFISVALMAFIAFGGTIGLLWGQVA